MRLPVTCKKILQSVALVAGLSVSANVSAGLINADFSDGLNGWEAEYHYYNYNSDEEFYFEPIVDFSNFTANISTETNKVTLNTSFDDDNDYFGVYLFQDFLVDANSFQLSLMHDISADYANIVLVDENADLLHDFINDGLTFDISGFSGSLVSLQFGIEDEDFVLEDTLSISNISISQLSTPVPEPTSFAIFSLALLGLRYQVNRRQQKHV